MSRNPSFRTLAIDSLAVGRSFLPTGAGEGVIRGANYIIEIERGEWIWERVQCSSELGWSE